MILHRRMRERALGRERHRVAVVHEQVQLRTVLATQYALTEVGPMA